MPDDPIPEDIREVMNSIGRMIDSAIKQHADRPMGFMLMVFDFGEGGTTSYLSNVERESMITALNEFIQRQEQ